MSEGEIILSEKLLQDHPVWMWNAQRTALVPVEPYKPLPMIGDALWIRAEFAVPDGNILRGYVVDDGAGIDVIGLFVGGEEYMFGKYVQEDMVENLESIRNVLGQPDFQLFPLRYETEFHYEGQPNLSGAFDPS